MDPFNEDYNSTTDPSFNKNGIPSIQGDLYINIGNISEDIIKDGRMSYENGLPGSSQTTSGLPVINTGIANVPLIPPTINAFSQDNNDRPFQDVGYDGFGNTDEATTFSAAVADMQSIGNSTAIAKFTADPSNDDYTFFRDDRYDAAQEKTIVRYSRYNNPQGNSPTVAQYSNANPNGGNYPTGYLNISPNIEDVNRDNTLSETESYYQYRVHISQSEMNPSSVGTNHMVDAFDGSATFGSVKKTVKWYQFKIPITQFEGVYGGIDGFNSIRFMRVFMKGFDQPVLLRMARFELVRSDWRAYEFDLRKPGEYIKSDDNATSFDVSAVSLQENSTKVPVNYVMPPGIQQQQNIQTTNLVLQNEQALQMRVCNLKDGDSRAVFKNVDIDTRMFQNIKMDVHAEAMNNIPLNDGDLHLFVRVGTDYNNNFYEYELPLKLTPKKTYDPNSSSDRLIVWPAENQVNIKMSDITLAKADRNATLGYFSNLNLLSQPFSHAFSGYTINIVGNPNMGTVKSIMIGIRNPKDPGNLTHCAEVWVNELRLTDFNNQGGWAATGQMQVKLADLGVASLAGTYSTPFFGSVESKIADRSKQTTFNWDASTSINAGKFFPSKWKITLPIYYNYGQTVITPLFNPLDPDVRMSDFNANTDITAAKRKEIKDQVLDFTERKGFNLTNVRIDGLKRKDAKPMPWDIRNFSTTFAFTQLFKRNISVDSNLTKQYRANLTYQYSIPKPLSIKPFSKMKIFQNKWFALIKDFNLQLLPNSFGMGIDVNRSFSLLKNRDITSFYAGSEQYANPILYNKNFLINRNYNFKWDICKAIKFDFTANNDGRILEPIGDVSTNSPVKRDSIMQTFLHGKQTTLGVGDNKSTFNEGKFGANLTYRQQMNLNINLPLNKIPILDFMTVSVKFAGSYTWTRAPFGVPDTLNIGNTINNTSTKNLTGSFNMATLYNKIPYFKRLNTGQPKKVDMKLDPKTKKPLPVSKDTANKKDNGNFKDIAEFLARAVMMIKNISLTVQDQRGQGLPNFKPRSQYLGMDETNQNAPGFLFTTGAYDANIRQRSAQNDWLSKVQNQTTPYIETQNQSITYRTTLEPHGSFKIELNGTYTKSKNLSEFMVYDPTDPNNQKTNGYNFHQSTNETGNFNITTFGLFRSLKDASPTVASSLFDEFLLTRQDVARQLASKNPSSSGLVNTTTTTPYFDGYSVNQQDVLIGAFYQTYTGKTIKNYSTNNFLPTVPLPNYTMSWDGLGKLKSMKKTFRSITIRHAYRSTYNVSGYTNNLLYGNPGDPQTTRSPVPDPTTGNANFNPAYSINAVTIAQGFAPLIKFDLQFQKPGWIGNFEVKRDKTVSLNITGPQIVETKGQEYIVGLGYRYPQLSIKKLTIQGKPLKSDLTLKMDFSYRRNLSIIRRIADDISTPTGGTNIITLRSSADYLLTPQINLRFYLDWIRTKPQTSASFPTANTSGGFSIRINFQ